MSITEYYGVLIHRNTEPHLLRYWAFAANGMVSADTLAGIKELIREARAAVQS
jgi:hypothetical protein